MSVLNKSHEERYLVKLYHFGIYVPVVARDVLYKSVIDYGGLVLPQIAALNQATFAGCNYMVLSRQVDMNVLENLVHSLEFWQIYIV